MLTKNKTLLQNRQNHSILFNNMAKHGISAKSQHLTRIMMSVISAFPWFSIIPNCTVNNPDNQQIVQTPTVNNEDKYETTKPTTYVQIFARSSYKNGNFLW